MASNTNQFALGQANADNPYNIESELVRLMAGGPAGERIASTYMPLYQTERLMHNYAYANQVDKQNQFAYAQAAAHQADEAQKNAMGLFSHAGGANIIAASPTLQQALAQDVAGPVFANVAGSLQNARDATTFQSGMSGANSASEAGVNLAPGALSRFIPGGSYEQGVPRQLQIERENNAARLQAAALHANAASGPSGSISEGGGTDAMGNPIPSVNVSINPKKASLDQSMQLFGDLKGRLRMGQNNYHTQSQQPVVPNAGGAGAQTNQTSAPPSNVAGSSSGQLPPPEVVTQARQALKQMEKSDPQRYQEIMRKFNGSGRLPLYKLPNGQWNFEGAVR